MVDQCLVQKRNLANVFETCGMKIIHFQVNTGLLYWSECVILIVILLTFLVKKKKELASPNTFVESFKTLTF